MTFGRIFNGEVLDIFEACIASKSEYLKKSKSEILMQLKNIDFAFKPCFLAIGDIFEENIEMGKVRNYFHDFFHANEEKSVVSLTTLFKMVVVLIGLSATTFQITIYRQNTKTNGNSDIIARNIHYTIIPIRLSLIKRHGPDNCPN